MAQTEGQRLAAQAVVEEMVRRGFSNASLSSATAEPEDAGPAVDVGTIADFLKGARWPRSTTLGRIERALGWEVGSLIRYSRGGPHPAEDRSRNTAVGVDRLLADVDDYDLLAELARRLTRLRKEDIQGVDDSVTAPPGGWIARGQAISPSKGADKDPG